MDKETKKQLYTQLNKKTERQFYMRLNSFETLYNVYKDKIKLNSIPLTKHEAIAWQDDCILNHGYKPKMIPTYFWCDETKTEITRILAELFVNIGIDLPKNFLEIRDFCYYDVGDSADTTFWNDSDVAIAFRRWIEKQTK